MNQNDEQWVLQLEESAQGTDLYDAPGAEKQEQEARDDSEVALEAEIMAEGVVPSSSFATAQQRRRSLADAMAALEDATASASAAAGWHESVEAALEDVHVALREHIDAVEKPDGLLADVSQAAPRLEVEVEIIRSEHGELLDSWERARQTLQGAKAISLADPQPIRERVSTLLSRLSLHRQRGADLLYEAYNVDIAAVD